MAHILGFCRVCGKRTRADADGNVYYLDTDGIELQVHEHNEEED